MESFSFILCRLTSSFSGIPLQQALEKCIILTYLMLRANDDGIVL